MRKTHSASSPVFSCDLLRFAEGQNTRKPDRFEKTRFGLFRGEFGGPKKEVGKIDL